MAGSVGEHKHLSFYSEEAQRLLGIPDSPVIHLAICTVAELLKPLDARSKLDADATRIQRMRVASGTALECLPIEIAQLNFLSAIGVEQEDPNMRAWLRVVRTNWLAQARAALTVLGLDPGMETKGMATRYGWLMEPSSRAVAGRDA